MMGIPASHSPELVAHKTPYVNEPMGTIKGKSKLGSRQGSTVDCWLPQPGPVETERCTSKSLH